MRRGTGRHVSRFVSRSFGGLGVTLSGWRVGQLDALLVSLTVK